MCPPDIDQTTRSPEEWHILAPVLEQQYDLTDSRTNVETVLGGEATWNAFDKLVVRTPADAKSIVKILSKLSRTSQTTPVSPLEALPNELMAIILSDQFLDASDIVALGLCASTLWRQCLNHIRTAATKAPWAETPLICTSTYLNSLPSTMYDVIPSFEEDHRRWYAAPPLQPSPSIKRGMCPARQRNWIAVSTYTNLTHTRRSTWLYAFGTAASTANIDMHAAEKKVLRESLASTLPSDVPSVGTEYLLRNHTTHECLAFDSVPDPASCQDQQILQVKGLPEYTLDIALVLLTVWTAGQIFRRSEGPGSLSGKWAGCKFDLVEAGDGSEKGWTNVTEEMVREWKR